MTYLKLRAIRGNTGGLTLAGRRLCAERRRLSSVRTSSSWLTFQTLIGYDSGFLDLKLYCNKDSEMIHVIATIEIAEGQRDAFLEEFRNIVPAVRDEKGCIDYGPVVDSDTDIEKQTLKGINVVTVVEKWESKEALKAHLVAAHMAEYRERVKDLVLGMTLHILEPA